LLKTSNAKTAMLALARIAKTNIAGIGSGEIGIG
jgi:hypothetical protein